MMTKKSLLIAILVAAGAAGFYAYNQHATAQQDKAAAPIAPVVAPKGIGALGRIEPRSRVLTISHNAGPEGAKIAELRVDDGYDVKAGDILAILADYPRKEAEVQQAHAQIVALQARLKTETVNRDFARKTLERRQKLVRAHAISQAELEAGEQAYQAAQAVVQDLNAQIDSARAMAAVAAENLANMTITAPIDGTVLRVMARSGERIAANGLLEMADLTQLDVVAEIYERDMPSVHVDQQADIVLPGTDDHYQAKVREIGFQVRGNDLNDTDPLADRDNRVVTVRLTLDGTAVAALRHQLYRQVHVSLTP